MTQLITNDTFFEIITDGADIEVVALTHYFLSFFLMPC